VVAVARRTGCRSPVVAEVHRRGSSRRAGFHAAAACRSRSREDAVGSLTFLRRIERVRIMIFLSDFRLRGCKFGLRAG
jgi:hypothetical protein